MMITKGEKAANLTFSYYSFMRKALFNQAKYVCIPAGRRAGKTFNAFNWILEELITNPNKSALWVDTTQRNLTEYVEIYVKKILAPIWHLIRYDRQGHKIEFPNGSFLHLRSAERPENMEGFEYDFGVCNEAGIIFKSSELWTNTLMPMFKNAQVRIVGTPKGMNYYHTLASNESQSDEWKTFTFTAYDSQNWEPGQLDLIKQDPSVPPDVWDQEYMAKFTSVTSNVICKRTYKESWRDGSDKPYTLNHFWIQQQLADPKGHYFLCFDGGMHTTHSAAILGYHNAQYTRDILLKEFYNVDKSHNLREIAMMAKEFCIQNDLPVSEFRLWGDPAIKTYGDEAFIEEIWDKKVNLLHAMKDSLDAEAKAAFVNRKTKRLTILNTELFSLRSDNKPAIIILKDSDEANSYGCPKAWAGMWGGQYRYEIKTIAGKSHITEDIEQIPPTTDIVDAYTYKLLAERYKRLNLEQSSMQYRVLG